MNKLIKIGNGYFNIDNLNYIGIGESLDGEFQINVQMNNQTIARAVHGFKTLEGAECFLQEAVKKYYRKEA